MPAPRSLLPVVVVGLSALPGCLLPVVTTTAGPTPPAKPAKATAPAERFAEYVTAPGQRVPLAEEPARPTPVAAQTVSPVEPPPGMVVRPEPPPDAATMPASAVASIPLLTGPPVGRSPAEPPLLAALRAHLEDRPAAAADHLKQLPRDSRQLLAHLLPATAAAGKSGPTSPTVARHLAAANEVVTAGSPLDVRNPKLVLVVRGFGDYDPVPAHHLYLGGGQATLYVEINCPPMQPIDHPDGGGSGYRSRLVVRSQIHDAAGRPVPQPTRDPGRTADAVEIELKRTDRSPIRDYHLKYDFPLPRRAGRYQVTLELTAPDAPDRPPAVVTVPFQVGG